MNLRRRAGTAQAPIELPGRSTVVSLVLSSGERVPARVVERQEGVLLIAATVPLGALTDHQLETMMVEFVTARGRVRLRGRVTLKDPRDPDLLCVDDLRSIEVLQEREYVRVKSARPVLVYVGRDQRQISSYTVDVSGGGFLLAGPDTLRVAEQIRFQLTIAPGAPPILGTGQVVRTDAQGRRSVAFTSISDLDQRRLVRFIFECQRAERRRGLDSEDRYGN